MLPAVAFPHLAPAGCRTIPARDNGGRPEENALALGQPRDVQVIIESDQRELSQTPDGPDARIAQTPNC